ncbi:MAG: hydantoinase B/oxoprolinase family protein [Pseudomonadota bacterium]
MSQLPNPALSIDPVRLSILTSHCRAAAEMMANTLYRTAHSTFVKETEDFTTGLISPTGATFAAPIELGATWFVGLDYANAIAHFDDYAPGDLCMTNDPYSGFVCTHSPDLHLWKPVFWDDQLVCFAGGHIHNTDVGGAVPASLSRSLVEVHQEGIRIPPTKLYAAGELNQSVLDILWTNVRVPDQNWGDLKAHIAAMTTGERKVLDMIERFGLDTFCAGIDAQLDYAETQARRIVSAMPDGEYFFADYIDEDAVGGYPCRIALRVVIEGDSIELDFTGSDPQLESSLNMPTGGDPRHVLIMVGLVYVLYAIDPSLTLNAGICRVATCRLPTGTVVNPEFPAAVGMRSLTCIRLQGIFIGAFSQAVPELLPAGPASGGPIVNVNSVDPRTGRRVVASIDPITGGGGGSARGDGANGSGSIHGFLKNTPVEVNEAEVPIKILKYGLATDSGGPGRYRGGLVTELEFQVFSPNTRVTARNRDRSRFTAWGLNDGYPGSASEFMLNPNTNREVNLGNTDIVTLAPGDVVSISCGGSGGWGHPFDRPAEAVALDVRRGFVSIEAARDAYGVIMTNATLNIDATTAHRAASRPPETTAFFNHGESRQTHEKIWSAEAYAALTEILAELPVHWRFFTKHQLFERMGSEPGQHSDPVAVLRETFAQLVDEHDELRRSVRDESA